jgi:hypothetical protein
MSGAPDDYEAKYMEAGQAIAHSRVRMAGWFFALMGAIALISGGSVVTAAISTGRFAPLAALLFTLPLLAFITLMFSHLRLTVTATQVIVQYGLFGPKIPVAGIEHVSAEDYHWTKYGGYGIRVGLDGTLAYSVPGAGGKVVRSHYRDAKGGEKKVVVSSDDPNGIVAAIERARAAVNLGVRVDGDAAAAGENAVTPEVAAVERDAARDAHRATR